MSKAINNGFLITVVCPGVLPLFNPNSGMSSPIESDYKSLVFCMVPTHDMISLA
jgi:hypothetical protein